MVHPDGDESSARAEGGADGGAADAVCAPAEVDLWWGGCSGWALLPSAIVATLLTAAIVACAYTVVDRRLAQLTIWSLSGIVWLVQAYRWGYCWFGYNYRLTSRRLFVDRGFARVRSLEIALTNIEAVSVERSFHSRWTSVGRIGITLIEGEEEVRLHGVRHPDDIAERIRQAVRAART